MPHPAGFDALDIGFDDPFVSFDALTLADGPPATAPQNLTAGAVSANQVSLLWGSVQGADSYTIERWTGTGPPPA